MLDAARHLRAYVVAVLAALAGLAVTAASVKPLAGPFFMFQFAAVVGAALYGGLGPGLLTMVLSGIGFYATYFAPTLEGYEAWRLASFVVVSIFFASLAARMRRARLVAEEARARAEAAEADARAIGAQQERLVAVVSHDLRSPLGAITVTAEHLRRTASEHQARGLSRIVASAQRMNAMVRDLLDYARARHGPGLPVQPRPARMGDICRAALEEIRTARPSCAVLLEVTGDDRARLDPARVEQIVSNLVTNAIEHGTASAPVQVDVRRVGVTVLLEVTNQGAPIPKHLLPTLFDPFRPGDTAGSVGLGLFIVREVARAHGGAVHVRSDEQGTTFTVVFPCGVAEEVGAAATA
jgi:signal transduction histidine kinase